MNESVGRFKSYVCFASSSGRRAQEGRGVHGVEFHARSHRRKHLRRLLFCSLRVSLAGCPAAPGCVHIEVESSLFLWLDQSSI